MRPETYQRRIDRLVAAAKAEGHEVRGAITVRMSFDASLAEASKRVAEWPEWKRNALGRLGLPENK